jgi:hypothetical protein
MTPKLELRRRAEEYVQRHALALGDELGRGVHGTVYATENQPEISGSQIRSAVKVHQNATYYEQERDVYLRLRDRGVTSICGCHLPGLLRWEDVLWVLEMTVVKRPFVLDFAGAYLDKAPEFSVEVIADWRAEKMEQFGTLWPKVQTILATLEIHGVFMVDVNPGNIAFAE